MSGLKKSSKSILQNLALISQVGIMMLVPIVGGVLLGAFIDGYLKTNGIFLIIFILLGVGSAFRNLYVLSKQKAKEYDDVETPSRYVQKFEKSLKEKRSLEEISDDQKNDKMKQ